MQQRLAEWKCWLRHLGHKWERINVEHPVYPLYGYECVNCGKFVENKIC